MVLLVDDTRSTTSWIKIARDAPANERLQRPVPLPADGGAHPY
jgi:hypothetical protein